MSQSNGVIKIGRKGRVKFAFGEDGSPFEVDVVEAFRDWNALDETYRVQEGEGVEDKDVGTIPSESLAQYHEAMVAFVCDLCGDSSKPESKGEVFDFIARMREQYRELAEVFQPRSPKERSSPASSAAELRFSAEAP